ncbi:MAG TPA: hypothetical protein VFI65_20910 [Streptosporangiaceae bacterium]|nr:hypothetical protein [Streptosporangiaceae bacterium]
MRSSRVSVLARFGSAAAVAGLALAGALAPATASAAVSTHHHHKIATHLFVRSHAVKGTGHKSDNIVGLLLAARHRIVGKTIVLESRTHKTKFAVVASAKTDKNGLVKFTVTPTTRTAYVLVFKGTANFRHSRSAVIVLKAPKA